MLHIMDLKKYEMTLVRDLHLYSSEDIIQVAPQARGLIHKMHKAVFPPEINQLCIIKSEPTR